MSIRSMKGSIKKFNLETMGYMNAFERFTSCKVKDCITSEEGLLFIVDSEYMGKVLGFRGESLRKLEARFKKNIKIIEFSNDVSKFILNVVYPLRPREIKPMDGRVEIVAGDTSMKGKLIGRDRKNLKRLQELVARYFRYDIEVI